MTENHKISFKAYLNVLLSLLFLTALTVAVAQIDFGWANALIAMLIATIKGSLVLLYFMHLKYDDKFYWAIFGSGVFFLTLLFLLVKVDVVTRVLEINTL